MSVCEDERGSGLQSVDLWLRLGWVVSGLPAGPRFLYSSGFSIYQKAEAVSFG